MLDKVDIINARGMSLSLVLKDVSDGLALERVDGLGPVKATIVSSSFATQDGAQFQSARREARNLVLTIGLEADYVESTVADLRERLYDFFMTKIPVSMKFYDTNGLEVRIDGRVESNEEDRFQPEVQQVISIINHDPDFIVEDVETVSGNSTDTVTWVSESYPGTIETGILFTFNINRSESEFSLYHEAPDGQTYQMDVAGSFLAGDVLKISTVRGNKFVTLTRGGVDSSALGMLSPQSKWIELEPGTNKLRVYATGAAIPWTVDYITRYGAV